MNYPEYSPTSKKTESPTQKQMKQSAQPEQKKFAPCDFVIESKLGAGVFGEVFLATSESTGEEVALKRISKRNPKFDPQMVNREITAGEALQHDGIVRYKTHFETLNNIYLVYELVKGNDLCTFMTDRNYEPVNDKEARAILRQLVNGLLYCHSQGIAHRDIKLDNILITAEGKTKIIDFGLSTSKLGPNDKCKDYVGSPEYAAPEIMSRKPYNPFRSDVFSIGVVMYGLLFGEFPFSTADRWDKVAAGTHPPIRWADRSPNFPGVVSKEAKELIEAMLEVNPENRITVGEILNHKWFQMEERTARVGNVVEGVQDNLDTCRFFAQEQQENNNKKPKLATC
eukprot:TRINITY_DN5761_c0_g1_i2.p1 TRINITY_DN5761_c0_g1~~TRINITY_DN5761_c0_g1_i2.p1  ORF type:complete len:341 (+),score=90.50 TRINITY_DN5761_c0_g1_i2:167-1189(+)